MEQSKIDRINELTAIARKRELNEAETAERAALRAEYLAEWRKGTEATLNNIVVVEPDGTQHKLTQK